MNRSLRYLTPIPIKFLLFLQKLAQKYGYELPKIEDDPQYEMLMMAKDPRQIFYGLQPGWVINLMDETIIKPVINAEQELPDQLG